MRDIPQGLLNLKFTVEGNTRVKIHNITAHTSPDIILREFEHGLVLANTSNQPVALNLKELFPDKSFTRLQATQGQDLKINDGSHVGNEVTLPPRDGLFLIRQY